MAIGLAVKTRLCAGLILIAGLAGCAGAVVAPPPEKAASAPPQEAVAEVIPATLDVSSHGITEPMVLGQIPEHGKAILVNIPSFELIAFEDRKPVLRSRVIVGKPGTRTPIWNTETSVVRFRPTWAPTPRMVSSGKYRPGTRPAGSRNPLGYLAIRLEPGTLIYLHGTNKPQLFEREMRALSHGCVRVERWDEVAAWVLDLSVEAVQGHAFGRRTFDMETSGVPVIMTYLTEFPDAQGVMRTWPDIYRMDGYAQGPLRRGVL